MNDQSSYRLFNLDPLSMIRTLDALPFLEMMLLIIGGILLLIAIIVLVTYLIRGKEVAPLSEGAALANDMNAAIYGLILAFLVVSMYDSNRRVEESISNEANALVAILQTSRPLNNFKEIKDAIKNYARTIVEEEWPMMRAGKTEEVWTLSSKLMEPLSRAIMQAHPQGIVQEHFYDKLPEMLRDLNSAHRSRLTQAEIHLPVQFWRVIALMTVLALWFLVYMNPWTGFASVVPIVIPGIVIALSFSLLVSLHYPFLGPFSVSNKPFTLGELSFTPSPATAIETSVQKK